MPGTEFTLDADLVLLAMGFLGPVRNGLHRAARREARRARQRRHGRRLHDVGPGVFAAGDMRRGQSLVVWAIAEGRKAAKGIDRFLRRSVA